MIKNIKSGKNVVISPFTNVYGCILGDNVFVGPFVEIQKNVVIGNNTRIQSHSFICDGVIIGNNVFIGHNVNTINDRFPKVNNPTWILENIFIEDDVSIGTGSTIMAGVTISKGSVVGANSLVTKNIPKYELWVGSPAKFVKRV